MPLAISGRFIMKTEKKNCFVGNQSTIAIGILCAVNEMLPSEKWIIRQQTTFVQNHLKRLINLIVLKHVLVRNRSRRPEFGSVAIDTTANEMKVQLILLQRTQCTQPHIRIREKNENNE